MRIAAAETLSKYLSSDWRQNYPLLVEQLSFADKIAVVSQVRYYQCGVVIYALKDLPGFWHEDCLLDDILSDPAWSQYPRASEYYSATLTTYGAREYVDIVDKFGVLCMRFRTAKENIETAKDISEIAAVRHLLNFEHRFGFAGTYSLPPSNP